MKERIPKSICSKATYIVLGSVIRMESLADLWIYRTAYIYSIVDTALTLLGHTYVGEYELGHSALIEDKSSYGYGYALSMANFLFGRIIADIAIKEIGDDYIVEILYV